MKRSLVLAAVCRREILLISYDVDVACMGEEVLSIVAGRCFVLFRG